MIWKEIKEVLLYTLCALLVLCIGGALIMMVGCSTYVFKLQNKDIVFCKDILFNECLGGVSLYRCDDGIARICQYNLEEVADDKMRKELLRLREEQKRNPREIMLDPFFIKPFEKEEHGI